MVWENLMKANSPLELKALMPLGSSVYSNELHSGTHKNHVTNA